MTEQTEQSCVWPFAEGYKEKYGGLPPSQQREAVKRLTGRRRNPLTEEQVREPSIEVEGVLTAVNAAYLSKKQRSKNASAAKREAARVRPDNVTEPEPEALADAVATISLEPAEIVAGGQPGGAAPQPAPAPVPQKSAPIPIPKKVVLPAAAVPAKSPAPQAAAPEPAKKKAGLAGRFA